MNIISILGAIAFIGIGIFSIIKRKWIAYMNAEYNLVFKPNYSERYRKYLEIMSMIFGIIFIFLGIIIFFKG